MRRYLKLLFATQMNDFIAHSVCWALHGPDECRGFRSASLPGVAFRRLLSRQPTHFGLSAGVGATTTYRVDLA